MDIKTFKDKINSETWDEPAESEYKKLDMAVGHVITAKYVGTETRVAPSGDTFLIHLFEDDLGAKCSIAHTHVLTRKLEDKEGKIVAVKYFGKKTSKAGREYNLYDVKVMEE